MKTLSVLVPGSPAREMLARFGRARLIRQRDGRFVVEGGGDYELREAREWSAHFFHEAVCIRHQPVRRG